MARVNIKSISPKELRPLRQRWLVDPGLASDVEFPSDTQSRAHHMGAIVKGKIYGIASVYHEPRPAMVEGRSWRLQALAVAPGLRREGFGTALVEAASRHVLRNKGNLVWANVPVASIEFFRAMKFEVAGDAFEMHELGAHHRVLLKPKRR